MSDRGPDSVVNPRTRRRVGEWVRTSREAAGKTQAELAAAVGTHQSWVSDVENARTDLTVERASLIADFLGREVVLGGV